MDYLPCFFGLVPLGNVWGEETLFHLVWRGVVVADSFMPPLKWNVYNSGRLWPKPAEHQTIGTCWLFFVLIHPGFLFSPVCWFIPNFIWSLFESHLTLSYFGTKTRLQGPKTTITLLHIKVDFCCNFNIFKFTISIIFFLSVYPFCPQLPRYKLNHAGRSFVDIK